MLRTGSVRVARINGIAIEVHLTFGLIILWGAWQGWVHYGGASGALFGVLLTGLLFACILIHELGHGLQAQALKLKVRRIILLPIGGFAQLDTPPSHAWQELLWALAGPVVNLGVALILGAAAYLMQLFSPADWANQLSMLFLAAPTFEGILLYLVGTNLILFVFNMLPAFPMDGAHVLRAALALAFNYELATQLSAWITRLFGAGMLFVGFLMWFRTGVVLNPAAITLVVLGIIVFGVAWFEEIYVRRRRALVQVEVQDITQRAAETLAPWDTISGNLIAKLFKHEQALPVIIEGRVVGLLTYHDVQRWYRQGHHSTMTVAHVMRTSFPCLRLRDTLWVALQEMDAFQLAALPVVDSGLYQGMVRLNDINHAWRFAMRRKRGLSTLVSGD